MLLPTYKSLFHVASIVLRVSFTVVMIGTQLEIGQVDGWSDVGMLLVGPVSNMFTVKCCYLIILQLGAKEGVSRINELSMAW